MNRRLWMSKTIASEPCGGKKGRMFGRELMIWMTTLEAPERTGPANQAGPKGMRESDRNRGLLLQLDSRDHRE
jgi:hypothetical protein